VIVRETMPKGLAAALLFAPAGCGNNSPAAQKGDIPARAVDRTP
jgi:hypothetical protein